VGQVTWPATYALPVPRDVEGSHGATILQIRERAGLHRTEIEEPEVL